MRVLHLRDSPWLDGPGRTIVETGAHVDPSRIEYHIGALVAKGSTEHALVDAARRRGLNIVQIEDRGRLDRQFLDQIVALIDRLEIDVLHASEFRSSLIAQFIRRRRPKLRYVATVHGWIANTARRRIIRFLDKLLLRSFDHVVAVSDATRALIPRWWVADRKVTVLRNALVLKTYGKDVVLTRRRPPVDGKAVLLNVGRLSPEKGQEMLLEALHALSSKWPSLRLKFAGIGPLEQTLRDKAAALGIADRVEFIGYVTQMPSLYAQVDLLVQSSFTEGLPNVILEAAYLQVPIVATAVGGTAEVVGHQRTAWMIEPDLQQLIDGIDRYMSAPEYFIEMAQRAHRDIVEQFSFDVRTERMTEIYERLVMRS